MKNHILINSALKRGVFKGEVKKQSPKKPRNNRVAHPRHPLFERELKEWQRFYQVVLGIEVPLEKINPVRNLHEVFESSRKLPKAAIHAAEQQVIISNGINIPRMRQGFDRIIVVADGLMLDQVYASCAAYFPCVRHYTNLDQDVAKNERVGGRTYVLRARGSSESDVELANLSANELLKKKIKNITLLEYLLYQLKYFTETGKLLDAKNITMCAGSRYKDGRVPTAISHKGELKIHWCAPHEKNPRVRSREVITG